MAECKICKADMDRIPIKFGGRLAGGTADEDERSSTLTTASTSNTPQRPTQKMVNCPQCYGTGMWNLMPGDAMAYVPCPSCGATGKMREQDAQAYIEAMILYQQMYGNGGGYGGNASGGQSNSSRILQCPICKGSGRCDVCAGKGWRTYNGYNQDCTRCKGNGKCQTCYGMGTMSH